MTVATQDLLPTGTLRTAGERRRSLYIGIVYLALSAVTMLFFATDAEGDATFGLVRPQDRFSDFPDLVIPAAGFAWVAAIVLAGLGAAQLARGFGRASTAVLAIGLVIFVFAFLAWAAAGASFSLVGMCQETVVRSVPLCLGALAGLMCERAGVINIAIEGMLLAGAFVGAVVGSALNSWVGLVAAVAIGAVFAWVLAVLSIRYLVNQIIVGVVINIFVLGLTSFLAQRVLSENPQFNSAPIFRRWAVPLLSDIPFIGPVVFDQNLFVYGMYVLVAVVTYVIFHTRWGLRVRAVGEHPQAADTVGVDVYRVRYINVMLGGAIAGFAGAYFTLGSVGRFDENMTGGRGFIALAALIFGRYHPVGALGAALVFGFADALQQKLAILQTGIPSEFLLMAPYLVTILAVAGLVGSVRVPAADGQPYIKQWSALNAVGAEQWADLRRRAVEMTDRAYAPYSEFRVGAAGLTDDGRVVVGCNVENGSYGLTLCAECGLVSDLHATGGGRLVAVVTRANGDQPVLPCGRCRQLLHEAGGDGLLVDGDGTPRPLADLLPDAFDFGGS